MVVSLLRFLQNAEFGNLRIGMSRQEMENLLGPPEKWGGESRKHHAPNIYVYGYLEVYFDDESRSKLTGFFVDGMKEGPFGFGKHVAFADWDLRLGDSALMVRSFLSGNGIAFIEIPATDVIAYRIRTASNVELGFDEEQKLGSLYYQF